MHAALLPPRNTLDLPRGATARVLVNRRARHAGQGASRIELRLSFFPRFRPELVYPEGPAEAAAAARASARRGDELLVVAGGDGSVNQVVNAIAGLGAPLAVLPLGAHNDLARAAGLPLVVEDAARRIAQGRLRWLDLVRVNGRRLCTMGGVGVVAESLPRRPWIRSVAGAVGLGAWPLAALGAILRGPAADALRIAWRSAPGAPEQSTEMESPGLFIANQGTAAGLSLSPGSRNDDGRFELCLIPAGSRARLAATLALLAAGRAAPPGELAIISAVRARIESQRPLWFSGDGEPFGEARTFEIEIEPRALALVG